MCHSSLLPDPDVTVVHSVAQLVKQLTPVVAARVRDAAALDTRPLVLTRIVCGRRQRSQPVEVGERGGPCQAMWKR